MSVPRRAAARSVALLFTALCVAYAVEPLLSTDLGQFDRTTLVVAGAGLAVYSVLLGSVVWRGAQGPVRGKPWALVAAAILGTAIYLRFGPGTVALPALVGGAAGFVLSRGRAAAVAALTVAVVYVEVTRRGLPAGQVVDLLGRTLIVMAVVYAVGRSLLLAREIERNQAQLARLAVVEERLRFSRDLHDVLGHSLSVISLKGEVAARLAERDPGRAVEEMNSVVDIARRSVADVRAVARGYRRRSFVAEVDRVVGVLEAAGVHCAVDLEPMDPPETLDDAFSWVVREAATNIIRHSDAARCGITAGRTDGQLFVEVRNDGVRVDRSAPAAAAGQGLDGLAERLTAVDGRLEHGVMADGRFRLRASAPAGTVRASDDGTDGQ